MPDDKKPGLSREDLVRLLQQTFPDPHNNPTVPEDFVRRIEARLFSGEDQALLFAPHMRRFLKALSEDDVRRFERLLTLSPKTVEWLNEKNDRELASLDRSVEFIASSRTAGRVIMIVSGSVGTLVGGAWALARNGYDMFSLFRGGH